MLEQITPVILTFNEAANIGRTLDRLSWATDVVVVDSFSNDETLSAVARLSQARVFQRRFDAHADQWNFALHGTDIATEWVLALDADYVLTSEFVQELGALKPGPDVAGYRAGFVYCVQGRPLRGTTYPPVTVLCRRELARYQQDGHTQRVAVKGSVGLLASPMLHDDRKPMSHWILAQNRYMRLEAKKLLEKDWGSLGWADRLRRLRLAAPALMLFYCLFPKMGILDGRAGIYYAFQRAFSELMLSLYLLESDLKKMGGECLDKG